MPVIIPKDLVSESVLKEEKITTIWDASAIKQDIRPLKIGIVNLMPDKTTTEIQLLRLLSNTALQIEIDLIHMGSYKSKNTAFEHLEKFYKTYDEIKNKRYDALIVTGAPVEKLDYADIKYWPELRLILDFAKVHVYSTMFICWGAQAALYYYYGIESILTDKKIFGIYDYKILEDDSLLQGFDDFFYHPQSRYTYINKENILKHKDLKVLSNREDTGVGLAISKDQRLIFNFGHWEYDEDTLHKEYVRDLSKNLDIIKPINYYKNNDPEQGTLVRWRSYASVFFSNWINSVYQGTPYDLNELSENF
ncbi:MAG: homoserine O-succinyltransferase [Erysipelotrichaceae bacterium]|nr:homoserine O-succinyltransferase [Erysipelotrichaceae bacterium]